MSSLVTVDTTKGGAAIRRHPKGNSVGDTVVQLASRGRTWVRRSMRSSSRVRPSDARSGDRCVQKRPGIPKFIIEYTSSDHCRASVVYVILRCAKASSIHSPFCPRFPRQDWGGVGAQCGWDGSVSDRIISIILLIGIVKKTALCSSILRLLKNGITTRICCCDRKACLLRFRPILMTTVAALPGSLALGTGTGPDAGLLVMR